MKYFNVYVDIMNLYEKELMYNRSKLKQMHDKKKTKAFQMVNNKGIAEELISSYKENIAVYKGRIKEVKALFDD